MQKNYRVNTNTGECLCCYYSIVQQSVSVYTRPSLLTANVWNLRGYLDVLSDFTVF